MKFNSNIILILYIFIIKMYVNSGFLLNYTKIWEKIQPKIKFFLRPLKIGEVYVEFYLYKREMAELRVTPNNKEDYLKSINFNTTESTAVLIHGFLSGKDAPWLEPMVRGLLKKESMNVIVMDWSVNFYKKLDYVESAIHTQDLAEHLSSFLCRLSVAFNKPISQWGPITIIGHSIGSHVAGVTAKFLHSEEFSIFRVVALDPAAPYFDKEGADFKINRSYVQFMDVIHSNSGKDAVTFGLYEALGHVDFYVNKGDHQPQCRIITSKSLATDYVNKLFGVDAVGLFESASKRYFNGYDMLCDHTMACRFFTKSLETNFLAVKMKLSEIENINMNGEPIICNGNEIKCITFGYDAVQYKTPDHWGTYFLKIDEDF